MDLIRKTIRMAGEKMLSFENFTVMEKQGHANFVTQADIEVQAYLLEELHKAVPQADFFAEEKENGALTDGLTFVIDPIDGTTNFMRGRRCSSISIALLENKAPILGAVLNPYTGELFHAEKGKGAFLNSQPIHVSSVVFSNALVGIGTSPYDADLAQKTMRAAERFLLEAGDLRRTGSAAIDLCDIACGRSDIFWELILSPWDYAAGALIVTEAGGVIGSPGKGPLPFECKSPVLAANPLCYSYAQEILQAILA